MAAPDAATEHDVALDIVAALDMYEGLMGSEETTIENVEPFGGPTTRTGLLITLDNGQAFRLTVQQD